MKINWKVRLRNRVWLTSMFSAVVSFAFTMLSMLDLCPAVTQDAILQAGSAVLFILTVLGVVADPTTAGVGDSAQALTYDVPRKS